MAYDAYQRPAFTYIKDKKIAIYKKSYKTVPPGTQIEVLEPISDSKLWACYRSLSGNETYAAKMAGFEEECYFTVNWRKDIVQGMQVLFRDKVYEITRVDDFEGYKQDLKLTCKKEPHFKLEDYPEVK